MEKMIDLKDLLKHEVIDLYSAEEQIIEALPAMIDKAKNANLKKALQQHLKITEKQKGRLDKVQQLMTDNKEGEESGETDEEKRGFFSRLFGNSGGMEKCKGMEGLIDEGQKIMGEDISPEALDAAIIASAQKIEHYEISGYGTARTFARELQLREVQQLLEETLKEEYEADDLLTQLAVKRINPEAEKATTEMKGRSDNEWSDKQAGKNKTTKTSESREQESSAKEKRNTSSSRSDASKNASSSTKANASKSGSSRPKSSSRSGAEKKKKSAPKRAPSKTKKASGSKKKAPAR